MNNLKKNVILEGIFASEVPDTSGECILIKGMDIDMLPNAPVNTEHVAPEHTDENIPDKFKGFQSIIGRVVSAKKIFSQEDCDNEREKKAWNEIKKPILYGQIEIFDGEDAPDNAKAAAALARMYNKISDGPKLGLSVEGSTLKRSGNILEKTVIRAMAATLKPCNRTAFVDLVKDDSPSGVSKSMVTKTADGGYEPLRKSVSMDGISIIGATADPLEKLADAVYILKKTLTAGGTNTAPGSLTNGSALQKESQGSNLQKVVQMLKGKDINITNIKNILPNLSDSEAKKVFNALKARLFMKSLSQTEDAFKKIRGKAY